MTVGGCLGVEVMVIVHIWLSRRLLSPSYTTKWKMSVTGWLPVSKEVTYLSVKKAYFKSTDKFSAHCQLFNSRFVIIY